MPLNKPQQAVATSDSRFRVFTAGRRVGKTFLAIRELARFARHPKKKILYVCPTFQQARDIIWENLKERITGLGLIKNVNESRLEITLVNGSTILLRSGDAGERLRGQGFDFVCFDETADLAPNLWYEITRPALSSQKPPGSALFCGTPKGIGNWFKDLYDLGQTTDPDWASFQFTSLEGGNIPESEIASAKRDLDERTFKQEYEASFETYSGIIAYNFTSRNIVNWKQNPAKQILVGLDFNIDPMSAVIMVKEDYGLHAIDEIVMFGSNTHELVAEIKNRYPNKKVFVFPDASGAGRRTSSNGVTDVAILQNAGFVLKMRNRNPAVRDRINALNSVLKAADGSHKYFIDPKCKNLIKSFNNYTYKEGTQVPDKGQYDHIFDAATYCIEYLYPVTRDVMPDKIKTFGVY